MRKNDRIKLYVIKCIHYNDNIFFLIKLMLKITLDTNILFDYFNPKRKNHQLAKEVFSNKQYILYISKTTLREVQEKTPAVRAIKLKPIEDLINSGKLNLLPEPQMGFAIPMSIPLDMSHISPNRDKLKEKLIKSKGKGYKGNAVPDSLIAEAHLRSNNDYLLTANNKDFVFFSDIKIIDYKKLLK